MIHHKKKEGSFDLGKLKNLYSKKSRGRIVGQINVMKIISKRLSEPSSSPIQTVLSALESHQIMPIRLAGLKDKCLLTAGREFHPAPKMNQIFCFRDNYTRIAMHCIRKCSTHLISFFEENFLFNWLHPLGRLLVNAYIM